MEVKFFDKNLERFIFSLEKSGIAKVLHKIELLEYFGSKLKMPHSANVADGILELRINGSQKVRILYCFHNNSAILLEGFIKKTNKTPRFKIKKALDKKRQL